MGSLFLCLFRMTKSFDDGQDVSMLQSIMMPEQSVNQADGWVDVLEQRR